jgi:hypothetical protein
MPKKPMNHRLASMSMTPEMCARYASRAAIEALEETGSIEAARNAFIACLPVVNDSKSLKAFVVCIVEGVSLRIINARTATTLLSQNQGGAR